jgi:lipopolysaccharide transport system permease protein/teichoic acid transport system permease protein
MSVARPADPSSSSLASAQLSDGPFLKELRDHWFLIAQLTRRDFLSRYAGSSLGFLWAFLQPLMMMAILWFVFTHGLKAGALASDVPFVVWFFPASVAWTYVQDGLATSTNAVADYAFLVKKVRFRVRLLPLVRLCSAALLHGVFLALVAVVLVLSGRLPTVHWLQIPYYFAGATLLLLGLSWITAALQVFSRDVGQLVGVALQLGFWGTPIIWNWRVLPETWQPLLMLNPVFYLTEGYRNSFVYGRSVLEHGVLPAAVFWALTALTLFVGHTVFHRLRPHFGDVL